MALSILLVALATGVAALWVAGQRASTSIGTALIGGPFSLVDQTGKRVSEKDFAGKHVLIFFGYTFCPDICPSTLQVVSAALDKMGADAERITPVFVTIDPERDTVAVMKDYVANFHPRMVGLTGTPTEIAAMAKQWRTYYAKPKSQEGKPDYLMDHATFLYLMGPDGKFVKVFEYTTDAAALADRLKVAISGS